MGVGDVAEAGDHANAVVNLGVGVGEGLGGGKLSVGGHGSDVLSLSSTLAGSAHPTGDLARDFAVSVGRASRPCASSATTSNGDGPARGKLRVELSLGLLGRTGD